MDIQFNLSDDQLTTLLKAFSNWYENDEREKKYAIEFRERDKKINKTLLNKEFLSKIPDDALAQKIFEYSRTLEGPAHIRLGMPRITGELKNLKRNLTYLADSSEDPFIKAQEILEGEYKIPIFAKAFWTPLLQAKYPDVLPNWNNKTENFFEKVGIKLKTSKLNIEEKYRLISEAFLYIQKLDPKKDFHNLNHLMHYGTVIDEGVALIENFLNPQSQNDDIPKDYIAQKFARWRAEHVSEERINVRRKAESIARNLLNEKTGNFDEGLLRKFFELINEDFWKGKIRHTRFGLAYTGHNVNEMIKQSDKVNEWINLLWRAPETELKQILNEYYTEKPIKNAGRAFPSLILYIRNPNKFNNCFYRMVKGLQNLTDFPKDGYSGDFYFEYNDKVNQLKKEYGLIPEEIDIFLCLDESEIEGNDSEAGDGLTETNQAYSTNQCAHDVGFEISLLKRWVQAIERKGQAVFYGPPGTGKTYIAEHIAKYLIGGGDGFYEIVQFHPAYAYEDFIQGIRPKARDDGNLDYPVVPGRFLQFCEKALKCKDRCVLIIDEINRANLARVFGELMYLLEYRDQEVSLSSGGYLRIPNNVRIIGTMNTADRSIALVDHALRRRFAFLALYPNYEVLNRYHQDTSFDVVPLIDVLKKLNKHIADRHYEVGISFFLRKDLPDHIEDIWRMEIEPYLEEYFFDQPDKTDSFRWDKVSKDILI